jgi:site-specific DNA recombinase
LDGTLDPNDYKEIKNRYEPIINQLESRMRGLSQDNADLDEMIAYGRKFFRKLNKLYLEGTFTVRQQLIGSMFPGKLIFEKNTYRTIAPNALLPLICRPGKGFKQKQHKKSPQYTDLSTKAPQSGLEPETL